MADPTLQPPEKSAEQIEKKTAPAKEPENFDWNKEKMPEQKESAPYEKNISDELKREVELMKLEPEAAKEAEKKSEMISFLGEKEKIGHLLDLAKQKGVVYAVQVALRMNDPYLLDVLHDTLAKEGFYKNFIK